MKQSKNNFWEVYSRNYRHYVSQCQVSTGQTNSPHKAWLDLGEGSFTYQVNRREWGSDRDHLCRNQSP